MNSSRPIRTHRELFVREIWHLRNYDLPQFLEELEHDFGPFYSLGVGDEHGGYHGSFMSNLHLLEDEVWSPLFETHLPLAAAEERLNPNAQDSRWITSLGQVLKRMRDELISPLHEESKRDRNETAAREFVHGHVTHAVQHILTDLNRILYEEVPSNWKSWT
jgi:hypothetical protein